jgi:8-oxo-dGTP pyrophosphatase MutT (NUDIX family)
MTDEPEIQVPSAADAPPLSAPEAGGPAAAVPSATARADAAPPVAAHAAAEPLVIGAVSVFVFRGDRLLALRRSARSEAAAGAWDSVSGRLRAGEHPRDAAVREALEETGLEVRVDDAPLVAYTARRADAPMLVIAFRAESAPGEVTISAEHDEFAWMTVDEFARACRFPLLVDAARRAAARGSAPDDAHAILWEYRVKAGREAEFEAANGRGGDWERLFRRDPGYRGTELLRVSSPRGYITIDRWVSGAAFEGFLKRHRKEYDALDRRQAALTEREMALGHLERVTGPPGVSSLSGVSGRAAEPVPPRGAGAPGAAAGSRPAPGPASPPASSPAPEPDAGSEPVPAPETGSEGG